MYYNNGPSASDIADGISLYERRKEHDAYAAKGGQFEAPESYNYGVYIRHVIISCIMGLIVSQIAGGVLGVVAGFLTVIGSFSLLFIVRWKRSFHRYPFNNYKNSYFKRVKKYTVITLILLAVITVIWCIVS